MVKFSLLYVNPQQISIFALFCNLELAKSAYVLNFTWNLIFASMGARYEREENCKCKIFISLAPPSKTMYLLYLRPVVRWRQKYGWFQLFEMQSIQICITCRWKRTFPILLARKMIRKMLRSILTKRASFPFKNPQCASNFGLAKSFLKLLVMAAFEDH